MHGDKPTQKEKEMDKIQLYQKYADLIVKTGVNLSKDELLIINSETASAEFARVITEAAYKAGAKRVYLEWRDSPTSRLHYLYQSEEVLADIPQWLIDAREFIVDKKACYVSIICEDPDVFADVDAAKQAIASRAGMKAFRKFYDASMSNEIRWCLVAMPNLAWAKKMYPDLSDDAAVAKLWENIKYVMRLDQDDAVAAWAKHQEDTERRCDFINKMKFTELRYHNSLGTDIVVGLPKGYKFTGGGEKSKDGVMFTANMPTEELFSAPDKYNVNGTVYASMPLIHNGKTVDKFHLTLKDGKIVDYAAEVGADVLREIIDTDEGSKYFGEVALVDSSSPIQKLGVLFYNTLFDENASCHFAIGKAYATCVEGGEFMSKEELDKLGINDSFEHVDFMLGTPDLSVVGIKPDGSAVDVIKDGTFTI